MHTRDSQKPRKDGSRFHPRWSPFRSSIKVTGSRVTITNRSIATGLTILAIGITSLLSSVAILLDSLQSRAPSPPESWLHLAWAGSILTPAGIWIARLMHRCVIDAQSRRATFTFRGALESKTWTVPFDDLELLTHPVSLSRSGLSLSWNGYSLCIWHLDDLAMVIATRSDRKNCDQILAEGGPILQALHAGTGELLTATY